MNEAVTEINKEIYKTKYQGVIDADGHVLEARGPVGEKLRRKVPVLRGSAGA